MAPNICCGDLQLDKCVSDFGYKCSIYLIQPGEQEVIMGKTPPVLILSISSFPSSIMVRSAAKLVSKTLEKPNRRRPATICPVTRLPSGMPMASPIATLTAGAGWPKNPLSGWCKASQTSLTALFSIMAPVGQTNAHCPQLVQATMPMPKSRKVDILLFSPRPEKSMAFTPCTSLHTATQRPHKMHFSGSRTNDSEVSSLSLISRCVLLNRLQVTPRSNVICCNSQF